jgi:dipeptidase E
VSEKSRNDRRQIIAIGALSPATAPAFYRYLLGQCAAERPRVGFLPTASADEAAIAARFYQGFSQLPCVASHLSLFGRVADPAAFLRAQDIVLVGGGNTKSMLGLWREWGVDELLREAWNGGTILCGFSAGAVCWFEEALCDAWSDRLGPIPGLGFLAGSCCPHYDDQPGRRPTYQGEIRDGNISAGLAIDRGCAVHFNGTEPVRVVSARPGARAYAVGVQDGSIVETLLDVPVVEADPSGTAP